MKKLYLLIIGFFSLLVTVKANNTLLLQDLSIVQGTSEAVLPISMINENSITGFQCDLYLPSGVTVATDEYGDYIIDMARTTTKRHTISSSLQPDGSLRILCTSMTNATFSETSGTVLNVTLAVPESMAASTHNMSLKNIVLSDPDANRYTSPDITANFTVMSGGTEESVNILSLQDLSIVQGTSEAVLPISMINENSITGFQCDLYLPSGVTVATDEYGDYIIDMARTTTKRHTISSSLQPDGSLRILCTSMTNATFSGNSGVVLNVTLNVSEGMIAGTYNINLKNIVLSDPDANRYTSSNVTSVFAITGMEPVTITANDVMMVYGDEVPELTYESEGAELKGIPALSCAATSSSPVGTYPITISRGSVENEDITLENGTLTIVKAPLTISAGSYTKKQGEENPKFTATYSGFKNSETASVLTKQPTFTTDVTVSTAPGQYAVKVSGAEAKNYEMNYVNGTLTVTEADKVTVTANNVTMVYGDALPKLSYTSSDELIGVPQLSCSATSKSPVGTYPITISKGGVENYNVSYVSGTLTIVKAPLTISAGSYTKKQGEENPKFTATYSGFKNGETASVLTKQPAFTTDVTVSTAPGQYLVKVSDAEAQNYLISYVDGTITVTENSDYITFQDEEVERICLANWDEDKNGFLSKVEAAAITRLGMEFSQNKVITCFPELQYFMGLETIEVGAFANCSKLEKISFPTSLSVIDDIAFMDCEKLKEIFIPANVSVIGLGAFQGCHNLRTITVAVDNTVFDSRNNCNAVIKTESNELIFGNSYTVIPSTVVSIGNYAFGTSDLTLINIPSSVTSIGDDAFSYCASLTSITIPESVISIGNGAFYGCTSLTSITIPTSVTSIGNTTFGKCSGLTSVKVNRMQPLAISSSAFYNVDISTDTLYVPEGAKAFYEKANVWRDFGTIVEMPWIVPDDIDYVVFKDVEVERICLANWDTDGNGILLKEEAAAVTDLGEVFRDNDVIASFDELQYFTGIKNIPPGTFVNCHYLTSVQLPNTISIIGGTAFASCSRLSDINIPESVTRIERSAFSHCSQLKNITFPNSLTFLGSSAFLNCSKIEAINIPANVSVIESRCFMGCNNAQSVVVAENNPIYDSRDGCNAIIETATNTLVFGSINTTVIPNTIMRIGESAFTNATKLSSIEIPESVTRIEKGGFSSSGLKDVILPERLTYLGVESFQYCRNLEYIYIPARVSIIESKCFSGCTGLKTLRVKWKTPFGASEGLQIFNNVDLSTVTLYVPKGTKALYESAEVWKSFGTIVEDPAITADDITIEYGDDMPQLTFSSDVEVIGTPALSCSATPTSPVGTYPITISRGSVENENVGFIDGTLTIVKAPLTISAGSYTKKQGEENPRFTATYSGFKNGETASVLTKQPTFTTDVVASTAPGQYIVKVSGAEAQNYNINYMYGTLTVTETDKVTIIADNITMVYGDEVPQLTYTCVDELVGVPQLSCVATSKSPVGTYPITISKGSVENYNVSYVSGTLTIVRAPLTISAGSYTKKQGEENPRFTATYSGFKNGETSSVLTKQPTFTTDVTVSTAPGKYAVKVSGAEAQNYEMSYVDGTITVVEADRLIVIADDITIEYGDVVPELTYTSSGELTGTPHLICTATPTSPVGTYPITISKGGVENYNVDYVNGTLTIVKAPLTVSVGDYTRKEGEDNPVFEILYEGFKNDETDAVLTKLPVAFTTATKDSPAGMYDILIAGGEADNYSFEYEYGILTVEIADDISSPDIDVQMVDVYSIEGILVKKQVLETELREILPKGMFIVNGKKVVIR